MRQRYAPVLLLLLVGVLLIAAADLSAQSTGAPIISELPTRSADTVIPNYRHHWTKSTLFFFRDRSVGFIFSAHNAPNDDGWFRTTDGGRSWTSWKNLLVPIPHTMMGRCGLSTETGSLTSSTNWTKRPLVWSTVSGDSGWAPMRINGDLVSRLVHTPFDSADRFPRVMAALCYDSLHDVQRLLYTTDRGEHWIRCDSLQTRALDSGGTITLIDYKTAFAFAPADSLGGFYWVRVTGITDTSLTLISMVPSGMFFHWRITLPDGVVSAVFPILHTEGAPASSLIGGAVWLGGERLIAGSLAANDTVHSYHGALSSINGGLGWKRASTPDIGTMPGGWDAASTRLVGESDGIGNGIVTHDGGATWHWWMPSCGPLRYFSAADSTTFFGVTRDDRFVRSDDAGHTWTVSHWPMTRPLWAREERLLVQTGWNQLARSSDTGRTWQVDSTSLPEGVWAMGGVVEPDPSGAPGRLIAMAHFGSTDTLSWIAAIESYDAGATWRAPEDATHLRTRAHPDPLGLYYTPELLTPTVSRAGWDGSVALYLTDSWGSLHRSGDGGLHWEQVAPDSSFITMEAAGSPTTGMSVRGDTLYQTMNGGRDWTPLTLPMLPSERSGACYAFDSLHYVALLFNSALNNRRGHLAYTNDGGNTWSSHSGNWGDAYIDGFTNVWVNPATLYSVNRGGLARVLDSGSRVEVLIDTGKMMRIGGGMDGGSIIWMGDTVSHRLVGWRITEPRSHAGVSPGIARADRGAIREVRVEDDRIDIRLDAPDRTRLTVQLCDLKGEEVAQHSFAAEGNATHLTLPITGTLASGVYLLRLSGDGINDSRTLRLVR